jgi:hypothetical protein
MRVSADSVGKEVRVTARTFRNLAFLMLVLALLSSGAPATASASSGPCILPNCHCTGPLVWCEYEECPYGWSFCEAVMEECAVLEWCDWGTTCEAYCSEWKDGR